jgi:hypothetical protein
VLGTCLQSVCCIDGSPIHGSVSLSISRSVVESERSSLGLVEEIRDSTGGIPSEPRGGGSCCFILVG